jgi:hypothetical protein
MAKVKAANADAGLVLELEEIGGSYGGGCACWRAPARECVQ